MGRQITIQHLITLARKHLGKGDMQSSAELCLADAIALYDAGNYTPAKGRALDSLAYSVGKSHPDYQRGVRA
jgi:hypothetical protein